MKRSCLLLVLLLVSSCGTPYKKGEIIPGDAEFPGLKEIFETKLEIVSIHGMCTHDKEWVEKTTARLRKHLDLASGSPELWQTVDGLDVWKTVMPSAEEDYSVTNYAIVWSGLTAERKARLCQDSGKPTKSCPTHGDRRQAKINRDLKSDLMNDCLSDAIIYLGEDGERIRAKVRAALELIGRDRTETSPAALISESLGSKIIFDALQPGGSANMDLVRAALSDTQMVYMAANQLVLLGLAQPTTDAGLSTGDMLDAIRRAVMQADGLTSPPEIQAVGFTDPNDLLSYELNPASEQDVNVRIGITSVILRQLANPVEAHTGYLDRDSVWSYIACGSDRACPEKPFVMQ